MFESLLSNDKNKHEFWRLRSLRMPRYMVNARSMVGAIEKIHRSGGAFTIVDHAIMGDRDS